MKWADPNINASIYSFIQLHYSLSKYHTSSAIIRSNAIQLLSPSTTGNKMNDRLSIIGYCLCFLYKLQPYYLFPYRCHSSVEINNNKKYFIIEKEYQKYQQQINHLNGNNFNKNSNKYFSEERIDLSKQSSSNIQQFCEEKVLGKRVLYERHKRLK